MSKIIKVAKAKSLATFMILYCKGC